MTWATIARLSLEIVSRVAGYLRDKQLLDAGRAIERDRLSTEERERVDAANRARLSAGDDGVFVDPFDAATDVACQAFRPIAYDSREIPPDLTRQIREYHAVLLRLCPERHAGTARP